MGTMRSRALRILSLAVPVGILLLVLILVPRAAADGGGTATLRASFEIVTTISNGDCNGDGRVNVLDITYVERIILGLKPATQGADANQDGQVNALDITTLERMIMGIWSG